jgi:hypothetical protein
LQFFLRTYFPQTFDLLWSPMHLAVIARLETVISHGGLYALATPRGSGKTSILERAALWSVLTGRRRFIVIIAASEALAETSLVRIKAELEFNTKLAEDFPLLYPLRKLESQSRRCVGQLTEGKRTAIVWLKKRIVFPSMQGRDVEGSGGIIHVGGITGALRGLSHVDVEGKTFRPDFVFVDDPQDRESARSVVQTSERLAIINGDLLGLAGPGKRIAGIAAMTVIIKADLADQLLDPVRSPSWQGERYKLLDSFPTSPLWDDYAALWREGLLPHGDKGAAGKLYRDHRSEMDQGGQAAWEARYEPGEASALEHAMRLRLKIGEESFMSEYQNEPLDPSKLDVSILDPVKIANRTGGFPRGMAPPEVEKLTCFIDCGQLLLWWVMAGWSEDFGCSILDYGSWPEQRSRIFLARQASPTLEQVYPGGMEAAVFAGLRDLVGRLINREWTRSDGATLPISRILIDSGWQDSTVRLFVRQHPRRDILTPSKGVGIGPAQAAIADYRKRPGEKPGDGWILGPAGADKLRLLRFDSNLWKSRVANMLTRPMGQRGGVLLFGDRPAEHELLVMHLSSEYPTAMEAKGRSVNVWTRRADQDNHLFDCLIGAAVGASLEGISPLSALGAPRERPRPRVSFAALQAAARQRYYNR